MPEKANRMTQTTTYTFKYDADGDSIDLNTVLVSQIHFSTILNEIKNEIMPESDLSIKIRPLEKGSIPFDFTLNVAWIQNLLSRENIEFASAIVGSLVGLIQLKIWLKGRKPTRIEIRDNKVIVHLDGVQIEVDRSVYNIYDKNAVVDVAIKKAFEAIDHDEEITGIEIQDSKKVPLLIVERPEFQELTVSNSNLEPSIQIEPVRRENLIITKVVFEKGFKWQFFLPTGRKINAAIEDEAFMERINSGEKFAKGDNLLVELQVEKVFDRTVNIFIEKDFTVIKVLSHTPRPDPPQQNHLF